ncbi:hypothetical protein BC938DRAFT_478880 [Jimgerdemannia flammicorona]|uniref:Uncharacterized protein n=1 Tax=Jimgerdemannia flammicorona TaxID=994334 RepID=A0A433QM47_9FUNG|nr:hypothetical protein BC938DRAFT_478880 [Jimgerdemannia flammicorona]
MDKTALFENVLGHALALTLILEKYSDKHNCHAIEPPSHDQRERDWLFVHNPRQPASSPRPTCGDPALRIDVDDML